MSRLLSLILMGLVGLTGCVSPADHREAVSGADSGALTAGTVQRQITVGMSSAAVVEVLGAPNVVTTDEQRREVWVYDRFSTDTVYSSSQGGIGTLILGGGGSVVGGGGAGLSAASGARSVSQRTLTVIIKFDENGLVRDFAYRQSSF